MEECSFSKSGHVCNIIGSFIKKYQHVYLSRRIKSVNNANIKIYKEHSCNQTCYATMYIVFNLTSTLLFSEHIIITQSMICKLRINFNVLYRFARQSGKINGLYVLVPQMRTSREKMFIHKSNYEDQITSSIMDLFVIHTGSILKVFFDALE